MTLQKVKRALAGLAFVGIPLVVAASCDPYGGASFYRNDDSDCYGGCDGWVTDGYWYDDYYYDPYYYDDYYYDEVIFLP